MPKDVKIRILSEAKSNESIVKRHLMKENKEELIDRILLKEGFQEDTNAAIAALKDSILKSKRPTQAQIAALNKPQSQQPDGNMGPYVNTLWSAYVAPNQDLKAAMKQLGVEIGKNGIYIRGKRVNQIDGGSTEVQMSGPGLNPEELGDEEGYAGIMPPGMRSWYDTLSANKTRLPTQDEANAILQFCTTKGFYGSKKSNYKAHVGWENSRVMCQAAKLAAKKFGTTLHDIATGIGQSENPNQQGPEAGPSSCAESKHCTIGRAVKLTKKLMRRHSVTPDQLIQALASKGQQVSTGGISEDLIDAIVRYQDQYGLKPDGIAGRKTFSNLGIGKNLKISRKRRKKATQAQEPKPFTGVGNEPTSDTESDRARKVFEGTPLMRLKSKQFEMFLRDTFAPEFQRSRGDERGVETLTKSRTIQIAAADRFYGKNEGGFGEAIPRLWNQLARSDKSSLVRRILPAGYRTKS